MYEISDKFIKEYGQQLYDEIFEVFIGDRTSARINITNKVSHDVINHKFWGIITLEDKNDFKEICFEAEDGNWNGSRIIKYGDESIEPIYYRSHYTFELDICNPSIKSESLSYYQIRFLWQQKSEEFIKKVQDMNYDFHFDPSTKIKEYYRKWASERFLIITSQSIKCNAYDL